MGANRLRNESSRGKKNGLIRKVVNTGGDELLVVDDERTKALLHFATRGHSTKKQGMAIIERRWWGEDGPDQWPDRQLAPVQTRWLVVVAEDNNRWGIAGGEESETSMLFGITQNNPRKYNFLTWGRPIA